MRAHVDDRPGKARIAHLRHCYQQLARERTHHALRCAPSTTASSIPFRPRGFGLIIMAALRPAHKNRRAASAGRFAERSALCYRSELTGSALHLEGPPMTIKVGDKVPS